MRVSLAVPVLPDNNGTLVVAGAVGLLTVGLLRAVPKANDGFDAGAVVLAPPIEPNEKADFVAVVGVAVALLFAAAAVSAFGGPNENAGLAAVPAVLLASLPAFG